MAPTDTWQTLRNFINRFCFKTHLPFYTHTFLTQTIRKLKHRRYDWIVVENRPLFIPPLRKHLGSAAQIALHLHNDTLNQQCYYAASVIRQCDCILSVSDFINHQVRGAAKNVHDHTKAHVLYNRIAPEFFRLKRNYAHDLLRKQCGVMSEKQIVLYFGRLRIDKGVLNLIQAFTQALQKNNHLFLVLIGSFTNDDDQLHIMSALDRLPSGTFSHLNYIPHDQLPNYLSEADMIALPSICNEAFGLTIAEAMALGKTVITTDSGAIPELIGSNAGIIVKRNQRLNDQLAKIILTCAANPKLRMRIGRHARETALRRFQPEGYMEEMMMKLNRPDADPRSIRHENRKRHVDQ
nr:glycosyltransferase family 4 protein [Sporolactobacillus kofuensis]